MVVLVATYRNVNAGWIAEQKLYNLPLPIFGKTSFHDRVGCVVLIAEGEKPLAYEVKFREVVNCDWLKRNGYSLAASDKRHGNDYALYELGKKVSLSATLANPDADVFVASQRCPCVKIDAEFYKKPALLQS